MSAKPSEFSGGPITKSGVQPPPHAPTPSERLGLLYRTGDESGVTDPDVLAFEGLLPDDKQRAKRAAEGVLEKGQEWDRIQAEGLAAIRELQAKVEE